MFVIAVLLAVAGCAREPDELASLREFRSVRTHATVSPPARIEIPAIGVASDLQRLGLGPDGAIEVPADWDAAGWYARGPRPGQPGPAVILGHVDSDHGPAIFHRLRELAAGDKVHIARTDGSTTSFVVERVEQHAKTRFPTDDVYLPTLEPELRLVTCAGEYDRSAGGYLENAVVFASLAD